MELSYTLLYRVSVLAILVFLVWEISGLLRQSSAGIVITIGGVTAVAEGAMAIVLLVTAHIEASSFLWAELTSTMNT